MSMFVRLLAVAAFAIAIVSAPVGFSANSGLELSKADAAYWNGHKGSKSKSKSNDSP